jgi:hypothetical protein
MPRCLAKQENRRIDHGALGLNFSMTCASCSVSKNSKFNTARVISSVLYSHAFGLRAPDQCGQGALCCVLGVERLKNSE